VPKVHFHELNYTVRGHAVAVDSFGTLYLSDGRRYEWFCVDDDFSIAEAVAALAAQKE